MRNSNDYINDGSVVSHLSANSNGGIVDEPMGTAIPRTTRRNGFGIWELFIFVMAILTGTACSVLSKLMMGLHGTGLSGESEVFQKPIFQTFATFLGMSFGLVLHIIVLKFRLPFPGYEDYFPKGDTMGSGRSTDGSDAEEIDQERMDANGENGFFFGASIRQSITSRIKATYFGSGQFITSTKENEDNKNKSYGTLSDATNTGNDMNDPISHNSSLGCSRIGDNNNDTSVPLWVYFFLAVPSLFDLIATVLCMIGLQHVDVSIYQLLRSSGIVFVAWMRQQLLRDRLYRFQWIGVFWNFVSVVLVGTTAILDGHSTSISSTSELQAAATIAGERQGNVHRQALYGVGLILMGSVAQAMQFVFEEKIMKMNRPSPPLLLIGMEGLWGSMLCLTVVYPLAYAIPGDDDTSNGGDRSTGSYENPANTYTMLKSSSHIQTAFAFYLVAIFGFNFFATMVTYMLDSVWHAILENFRPISVWLVELFVYYVFFASLSSSSSTPHEHFGENWTQWSWIQVLASVILLYGTGIYNAPNPGSISLKGNWYSMGFDFTDEYREIEEEHSQMLSALVRNTRFEFGQRSSDDTMGLNTSERYRDYQGDYLSVQESNDIFEDGNNSDYSESQKRRDGSMRRNLPQFMSPSNAANRKSSIHGAIF